MVQDKVVQESLLVFTLKIVVRTKIPIKEVPVVNLEPLHGVLLEVIIDQAVEDAIVMDQLPPRLQVLHGAPRLRHAGDLFAVGELRPWLGALLDLLAEVDEEVASDSRELSVAHELAFLEGALEHLQLDLWDEIVIDWFRFVVVVDLGKLRLAGEKAKLGGLRVDPLDERE